MAAFVPWADGWRTLSLDPSETLDAALLAAAASGLFWLVFQGAATPRGAHRLAVEAGLGQLGRRGHQVDGEKGRGVGSTGIVGDPEPQFPRLE